MFAHQKFLLSLLILSVLAPPVYAVEIVGDTSSLSGDITATDNVTFNQASDGFYGDNLTGSGSLTKTGAGTLTLLKPDFTSTVNTYSGGTTVTAGALRGTTTSLQGNIDNQSTVTFDQAEDGTYAGIMSGSGALTKQGSGTVTLFGVNTYSGRTIITAGTLIGTTTSIRGLLTNNAKVVFDQDADGAYTYQIDGSGSLTKQGSGTLTLSSTNVYTGETIIKKGGIALGADLASTMLTLENGSVFNRGTYNHLASKLTVKGTASYIGNIEAQNGALHFYVPTTMGANSTQLNVTGTANITGATIHVGIDGATSGLNAGDKITLINSTGLTATGINTRAQGLQGIAKIYEFDLTHDAANLYATVAGAAEKPAYRVNPQTKALSEATIAGVSSLNAGADLVADAGMASLVSGAANAGNNLASSFGFGAMGGSSIRTETGSHIKVNGASMMVGAGTQIDKLTVGGFIETGKGNLSTYNSFEGGLADVHGSGETTSYGVGIMAHLDGANGLYGTSSARLGRVSSDFDSDLTDSFGKRAKYETKSTYAGMHVGFGSIIQVSEKNSVDVSSHYFFTRQGGDEVTILGSKFDFDAVSSHRVRVGAKLNHALTPQATFYFGLAMEREFDGKANATVDGDRMDAPSLSGNSGILEIGATVTPSKKLPLTLSFGVQGYVGQREGVSGNVSAKWAF